MYKIASILLMLVLSAATFANRSSITLNARDADVFPQNTDLLTPLTGKWVFEASVLGNGFIGSTFPGATTPPNEIVREGQKVTFAARLQTGQGSYGEALMGDFSFVLEKSANQDYLISVDSKSWLNLKQQKLVGSPPGIKGEAKITLDGSEMSLAISIDLTQPSGHAWEFKVSDSNGKPQRWFKLTFKPTG
jgi:hypothetical protein